MAWALSNTVASRSLGNRRSFTGVPPYPALSMSMCPANRLSNFVIMRWPPEQNRRSILHPILEHHLRLATRNLSPRASTRIVRLLLPVIATHPGDFENAPSFSVVD